MAGDEGPELGDAFGRALSDMQAGRPGDIVVERDDGWIEADSSDYFGGWHDGDTWVLDRAPGRVLDVAAGACIDPYQTSEPGHLAYHERNRRAGRMPGQVTIRLRYQRLASAWFGLLWMSLTE